MCGVREMKKYAIGFVLLMAVSSTQGKPQRSEISFGASEVQTPAPDFIGFEIFRTGNLDTTVTVRFQTINGTAVAGIDYTPLGGKYTFVPGVASDIIHPVELFESGKGKSFCIKFYGGGRKVKFRPFRAEIVNIK